MRSAKCPFNWIQASKHTSSGLELDTGVTESATKHGTPLFSLSRRGRFRARSISFACLKTSTTRPLVVLQFCWWLLRALCWTNIRLQPHSRFALRAELIVHAADSKQGVLKPLWHLKRGSVCPNPPGIGDDGCQGGRLHSRLINPNKVFSQEKVSRSRGLTGEINLTWHGRVGSQVYKVGCYLRDGRKLSHGSDSNLHTSISQHNLSLNNPTRLPATPAFRSRRGDPCAFCMVWHCVSVEAWLIGRHLGRLMSNKYESMSRC